MIKHSAVREWTLEKITEVAGTYDFEEDFKKGHPTPYAVAKKLGVLGEVCSHMGRRPYKMDITAAFNAAKLYYGREDFEKCDRPAFLFLKLKGMLNDACTHMKSDVKEWTEERICQDARMYDSVRTFKKECPEAYEAAVKKDLLDVAFRHAKSGPSTTKARIFESARRYRIVGEFRARASRIYEEALKKGLLEEACKHMPLPPLPLRDHFRLELWPDSWFYQTARRRIKCRAQFFIKHKRVYREAENRGILEDVCKHMQMPSSTKAFKAEDWLDEWILEEAKKYKHAADFYRESQSIYEEAQERRLLEEVWPDEWILEEAKKYKHAADFYRADYVVYEDALRRGLLEKACAHMKPSPAPDKNSDAPEKFSNQWIAQQDRKWTDEWIVAQAKKHLSRVAFFNEDNAAYRLAYKRGFLEDACKHMDS